MAKLSIICPTYNERDNLTILTTRIHDALSHLDYELIIVDDNSPDGTGELAEELSQEKPIKVIHREGKLGLASAVIEGFRHAEGDILGVIDADLQHPPEKIVHLYDAMGKADIVIASRYIEGGGMEDWTFTREVISRGAKMMPHFLFAKLRSVTDPLSGFFLFRRNIIDEVELNPIGYKILLEILVKGNHNGVAEVPYVFKGRERGQSNLTMREQVNYLKHLWRLGRSEKETERFLKFVFVGLSGIAVNEGVYWLLTRPASIADTLAVAISIEVSLLSNFILNDLWTFRDRRSAGSTSIFSRALKFNVICGAGALLNFGLFHLLTWAFGIFDMVALLIAIIIASAFNFVFTKRFTWQ